MPGIFPSPGDELAVTVTAVKPFGVFAVTDSGVPGLVRGAQAAVGAAVRVRVTEYDEAAHRFAATPV